MPFAGSRIGYRCAPFDVRHSQGYRDEQGADPCSRRLPRASCGLSIYRQPLRLQSEAPHAVRRGFIRRLSFVAQPPPCRRVTVPALPRTHVPDLRSPVALYPLMPTSPILVAPSRRLYIPAPPPHPRLRPTPPCVPIHPSAPAFLSPRTAPPTPPPSRPRLGAHICAHVSDLGGDIITLTTTSVKWLGCRPRQTRPCARLSPGQAPLWSIRTPYSAPASA